MRALVVIVQVVLLAVVASCGAPTPTLIPAASATPVSLEYRLRSGERWSSRDAAGRIIVIDVWATYCKPCIKSFPRLDRLAAKPDVVVVAVSVDEEDADVDAFVREVPVSFAIARDPGLTVRQPPLSFTQLPSIIVIDRKGRLRLRAENVDESFYDRLPGWIAELSAES